MGTRGERAPRVSVAVFFPNSVIRHEHSLTWRMIDMIGLSTEGKVTAYENLLTFCESGSGMTTAQALKERLKQCPDEYTAMRTLECLERLMW